MPVIEPDNKTPPTNDWKGFGDDLAKARDVAQKASGRTMAQRDRDSFLTPTPGQDIQSASRRGVQKNRVRGVQKNAPTNTQRGVQSPHSTGGAEEKILEAAKLKMLAPTEPIIVTPAPPFADEPVESAESNVITLAERAASWRSRHRHRPRNVLRPGAALLPQPPSMIEVQK